MLTQCPECKTRFRLNVAQLKAAAGKVRCSRCHTTFDALDNLCKAPVPATQQIPPQPPEEPTDKAIPSRHASASNTATPDVEAELLPSPPLATQNVEPSIAAPKEDTLSAFIDELEESTASDKDVALKPEESTHTTSTLNNDVISAALDSVDEMFNTNVEEDDEPWPLIETEESSDTFEQVFSIEKTEEELLPLVEPVELLDEPEETFEQLFSIEETEEEPLPLVEPVELLDEPEETFEQLFSIEETEEEPLPLVEPVELLDEPEETFEQVLSIEETEEEPLPLVEPVELLGEPEETFEQVLSIENTEEEPLPLVEPVELLDEPEETFEQVLSIEETEEELLPLVEPVELLDEPEETFEQVLSIENTEEEPLPLVEPVELLDEPENTSFEEELTWEPAEEESLPQVGSADDTPFNSDFENEFKNDLDTFVEESVSPEPIDMPAPTSVIQEQGELLQGLEEDSPDSSQLQDESPEAIPKSDPLSPFSEEQLEAMLSPTAEQAAEETATQNVINHDDDILELDSSEEIIEPPPAPPPAAVSATTNDYAIPAELAQNRQGTGSSTILWGMGILLMCALLLLQYLYYFRLQLMDNPQLRPLLVRMCDVTGCELPPRRDLGRIELAERLMQFHPNYEQSLLISATLANRADFIQPYPLVEVVMTDIEQRVVARRHFTPKQYLPNYDGINHFPANSEIPLMLEVLDPGNEAVGFEFRFY